MIRSGLFCFFVFLFSQNLIAQNWKMAENHPLLATYLGEPHPDAPTELADFAPMIGVCDCRSTRRNPAGVFQDTIDMVWQFKYIFNGLAIQDESWTENGYTSSIRQFNADSTQWAVTYFSSRVANFSPSTWTGKKEANGDVVLWMPQKAPNEMDGFSRLTFYNIREEGFSWIGEWVDVAQTITFPFWTIECQKRRQKGTR